MEAKLSSASTISLASFAASVPLPPMATPTSARFSAGASLTPSPVIAITEPSDCSASTSRSLCSGLVRAKTLAARASAARRASSIASRSRPVTVRASSDRPSCRAMARAVAAWSPVIILTLIPAALHSAMAAMASGRGGSISATIPSSVSPRSASAGEIVCVPSGMTDRASAITRCPSAASVSTCPSQ